jgi:hypothetical protein
MFLLREHRSQSEGTRSCSSAAALSRCGRQRRNWPAPTPPHRSRIPLWPMRPTPTLSAGYAPTFWLAGHGSTSWSTEPEATRSSGRQRRGAALGGQPLDRELPGQHAVLGPADRGVQGAHRGRRPSRPGQFDRRIPRLRLRLLRRRQGGPAPLRLRPGRRTGPRRITVNVVAPGYIADTEFFRGGPPEARKQALIGETMNGRAGTPADVAGDRRGLCLRWRAFEWRSSLGPGRAVVCGVCSDTVPPWLGFFNSEAHAARLKGRCLMRLNEGRAAIRTLELAAELLPDHYVRERAGTLIDLAAAHLLEANAATEPAMPVEAAEIALEAWRLSVVTESSRNQRRIRELLPDFAPYRHLESVQTLVDAVG